MAKTDEDQDCELEEARENLEEAKKVALKSLGEDNPVTRELLRIIGDLEEDLLEKRQYEEAIRPGVFGNIDGERGV